MPPAAQRENIGTSVAQLVEHPHWSGVSPVRSWPPSFPTKEKLSALGKVSQPSSLNMGRGQDAKRSGYANPPFIWPLAETLGDELLEGSLSGWRLLTGGA